MKQLIIDDAALAYLDFELPFETHIDASNYQLGAVIIQNNMPMSFFIKKLSSIQWR